MPDSSLAKLDAGERDAITLATELYADQLIVDDRQGRREAERRGIPAIGTLGVLREAATLMLFKHSSRRRTPSSDKLLCRARSSRKAAEGFCLGPLHYLGPMNTCPSCRSRILAAEHRPKIPTFKLLPRLVSTCLSSSNVLQAKELTRRIAPRRVDKCHSRSDTQGATRTNSRYR